MQSAGKVVLYSLLVASLLVIVGCAKKADEDRPISEVKAEAEKMNATDLRAMAMQYKKALDAKKGDIEKLTAQLKEIPVAEMLGEKAKTLKADMEKLQKSMSALQERFKVYYDKLKEKGGDLSGLEI
jgi:molecular chaperone GrpE (heat shock protein)